MKVLVYAVRKDELKAIEKYSKEFNLDVTIADVNFGVDTAEMAEGFDAVIILGNCIANRPALEKIASYGIKVLATRSAGYEKIDLEAAKELGIMVSNVPAYSPNAISEYAVTAALMLARNVKKMIKNSLVHNYSLKGLIGFELRKSTVGIIGTGRIGKEAAKTFKGFGAKVIAYDLYPSEEAKEYLEYVDLETLLKESDVVSLHMPLFDSNYHMINSDTLKLMKNTAVLVNTSRGPLVNSADLLAALKAGEIAGYAMDTYEYEVGLLHVDRSNTPIEDHIFLSLSSMDNVIVSPHYAFYTDEAVANMVEISFRNIANYREFKNLLNPVY